MSDFPLSVLSFSSIVTFGTMRRRRIATRKVADPTLTKGKVKPPRLYSAEPRAGPDKNFKNQTNLIQ